MKNYLQKGGMSILGMAIMAVFVFVILKSYFHIDLQAMFVNQQVLDSYHQTTAQIVDFWHTYLQHPVTFLWNSFIDNMQRIHNGQPTDFNLAGQNVIPNFTHQ